MNTIKRYRNENATITDSIGMLERLKTQLEINMQKEKVRQLSGGKFLDMEGLSMYLKSAIEKANEDLENVGLAVTVAESAEIEMNSASASYGSIAESALEKDDHKYDDLEKEIGLMI